ncbi:uncharacterized protein LOC108475890 [Gossypium arboreum]|uniref:uncharacterized protein LOC108475890 n=1 Tax=Gossypium arboreum TaxID=29729 RepID=UPI0008191C61|nr:uncharacterized protein LOC108475890 [Gossypium arboreum]
MPSVDKSNLHKTEDILRFSCWFSGAVPNICVEVNLHAAHETSPPLRANSTIAQIRQHSEDIAKKYKAMSCLQNGVPDVIFTMIMGSDKTRQQQLINLRRDFENLRIKESETIKQYADRIMVIVNNIRLLGYDFSDKRIVEKVITTLLEKSIKKVPSKPKADQPRAPLHTNERNPGQASLDQMVKKDIHPAHTAEGKRQNQTQQPRAEAQVVEEDSDQEEQVFAVSCSVAKGKAIKGWLINSGCTNHMTSNAGIFKSIDRSFKIIVKVGNEHFTKAEDKGDVLIDTPTGTKLVTNVLFVLDIDRNLLTIAQLLEKGYSIVFKGKQCLISDPSESKLVSVIMGDKSFVVNWNWDKNEPKAATEDLVTDQAEANQNGPKMDIDDEPVRGTRPLAEIYKKAQVTTVEPNCFEEAEAQ